MPLHPVMVHIPLALAFLVPLAALATLVAWWRGWLPARAWVGVLALQAILVAGGFAALQSGEADEERVEAVVSHAVLEKHEDAAKTFVFGAAGVLLLSLLPLVGKNEKRRRVLAGATAAGATVVAGLALNVGHMGGELVYEHGAASVYAQGSRAQGPTPTAVAHEDDDD